MPAPFEEVVALVRGAVAARAFPGACVEVGRRDGARWNAAFGTLTFDGDAEPVSADTLFDLASLTKVLATATLAMRAVDAGRLGLEDRVSRWLPAWQGEDRGDVTVEDLLAHCSGLPAYVPLYRELTGRAEFERAISDVPLEYAPRSRAIYSDLGFILLGFILEAAAPPSPRPARAPGAHDPSSTLAEQFARVRSFVTPEPLAFNPPRSWRPRCAPTERDAWRGRLLAGEVHDENCWALGGAAGHAGLFGTAGAVGAVARAVMRTLAGEPILAQPATMRRFAMRTGIPGSSRALGWDTMLPTSSCGTLMSATSIGHVGFTGTSLWIDWERDVYVVFLTNRVHPSRENTAIRGVRPRLHDAIMRAAGAS